MVKMKRTSACVMTVMLALAGCQPHKQNFSEEEEWAAISHAEMQYMDFDKVDDLLAFFDSVAEDHPLVKWMPEEDFAEEQARRCIVQIDFYRKGERRYFPDSLVRDCMSSMGFNIAAIDNHSGPEGTDLVYAEYFMMCAAFYATDITCLVETQTPDHCAGYYNFGRSYNPNPWWPYVFLKREKGFEVVLLRDYSTVNSIYQLTDARNRTYYLCSNNVEAFGICQWLVMKTEDGGYQMVDSYDNSSLLGENENYTYYFDQENLVWKYVREDKTTGKLIPISDEPAMRLLLDGERSRFY